MCSFLTADIYKKITVRAENSDYADGWISTNVIEINSFTVNITLLNGRLMYSLGLFLGVFCPNCISFFRKGYLETSKNTLGAPKPNLIPICARLAILHQNPKTYV